MTLCGPTQVRLDGEALPGSPLGAKALALLAYLAIERRAHSREALATLLWGDFPDAQARASLRQALAHLHRSLGEALRLEHGSVRLDADVELDVAPLLESRAGTARPAHALLSLDPLQFLAALRMRGGEGFAEWADAVRALLCRRKAELLASAVRDAMARLDWTSAIELADGWVALAPLDPDATYAAMESRHLGGRRADALAAWASYRAALAAEVGEPPPPALRALAERIARGAAEATSPSGSARAGVLALEAPLLCRTQAWDSLARAWRAARDGTGAVVVLSGEMGIGKSRLVGDFARRVETEGGATLRARSREATAGIPFATAGELLRTALDARGFAATDGDWLAEVARLVPEVRTRLPGVPVPPSAGIANEWRLYEAVAQLVGTLAAEQPLFVVVDDVHWCDASTAALVRVVAERSERLPVLWCVTVGTGADSRDAPGVRLAGALAALPGASSLALAPFGEDDVCALLVALGRMPDDAVTRAVAARVHAATEGVPGFMLEMVRLLRARGLLQDGADGRWVAAPALADAGDLGASLDVPALSRPIVDRVERLGDEVRSVLLTLAIAGDACSPGLLSAVHGVSRLRAAALGDLLVERGLAREADGRYRAANAFVAGVVRRLASGALRREVERALVRTREGANGRASSGALEAHLPRSSGEWRVLA